MALNIDRLGNDTIAAIATAASEAGVGIIRISGPDAFSVTEKLFRNAKGEKVSIESMRGYTMHYGFIVDEDCGSSADNDSSIDRSSADNDSSIDKSSADNDSSIDKSSSVIIHCEDCADDKNNDGAAEWKNSIVDEVLISVFKAPHSYTTQDSIEINTHGGVYLINRILEIVLKNGVRLAEPGEFTKRAFLGGRIDLSRAEAVMDLISSQNEFSRKTSISRLEGAVSDKIKSIRDKIIYEIAFIESALDDPDNYDTTGYPEKLRTRLTEVISELDSMLDYARTGRVLKEGINTVIVGKPNAGKSSLLNILSGTQRAIVTDIAGTTRDTLEETVRLSSDAGDIILNLTDTAGIRETEDKVEKIGVERAKTALENASLILFVLDTSRSIDDEDRKIAELILPKLEEGSHCIVLMNKSDLEKRTGQEELDTLFPEGQKNIGYISSSFATGEGIDEFKNMIYDMFRMGEIVMKNEVFLSNVREINEAENAGASLRLVVKSIDMGMSEDFYSSDLMDAYSALGRIIGESVEDDLVEEIFTKFCLGK